MKSHCHFHIRNVSFERVYYSFACHLLWFATIALEAFSNRRLSRFPHFIGLQNAFVVGHLQPSLAEGLAHFVVTTLIPVLPSSWRPWQLKSITDKTTTLSIKVLYGPPLDAASFSSREPTFILYINGTHVNIQVESDDYRRARCARAPPL